MMIIEWLSLQASIWSGRFRRFWQSSTDDRRYEFDLPEPARNADEDLPRQLQRGRRSAQQLERQMRKMQRRRRALIAKEWIRETGAQLYAMSFGLVRGAGWNVGKRRDEQEDQEAAPAKSKPETIDVRAALPAGGKAETETAHFAMRRDDEGKAVIYRKEGWLAGVNLLEPGQLTNAKVLYGMFGGDSLVAQVLASRLGADWRDKTGDGDEWVDALIEEHTSRRPGKS